MLVLFIFLVICCEENGERRKILSNKPGSSSEERKNWVQSKIPANHHSFEKKVNKDQSDCKESK